MTSRDNLHLITPFPEELVHHMKRAQSEAGLRDSMLAPLLPHPPTPRRRVNSSPATTIAVSFGYTRTTNSQSTPSAKLVHFIGERQALRRGLTIKMVGDDADTAEIKTIIGKIDRIAPYTRGWVELHVKAPTQVYTILAPVETVHLNLWESAEFRYKSAISWLRAGN
jgi:hypothetical protein